MSSLTEGELVEGFCETAERAKEWVGILFPDGPEQFQPNPNCPKCRAALRVGLKYYDCPDCKKESPCP